MLGVKSGVSVQLFPSNVRQKTDSLATRAYKHNDNDLSPVASSAESVASEPKLFRRGQPWTAEEKRRLLELRKQGLSWAKIAEAFPERSWQSLSSMYYKITNSSESKKKKEPWTKKEQKLLRELVKKNRSWEEMVEDFPGRTAKAIKGQYYYLLRDKTAPEVTMRRYTAEEDKLLLKIGKADIPWKEKAKFFDNRSKESLRNHYAKLKSQLSLPKEEILVKFTSEEDDFIVEKVKSGMKAAEIARLLGRSRGGVSYRIEKLEELNLLEPVPRRRRYTVADFELMREKREKGISWKKIATEHFPERNDIQIASAYRDYQARKQGEEEAEEEEIE